MLRRAAAVLLVSATAFAAGCGGNDEAPSGEREASGSNELAASDSANVLDAQRVIDDACDGSVEPDSSGGVGAAVSAIAETLRLYPEEVYEVGSSDSALEMKDVAARVITQLRGCKQDQQADRLQQTLDALD